MERDTFLSKKVFFLYTHSVIRQSLVRELAKNSMVKDLQLKLRGTITRISGSVTGSRVTSEETIYVILFDKTTTSEAEVRIHGFLHETLQDEILKKIAS